ncbi:hypothetical protein DXG01_016589 [Tephrocybe rancida]|nr:hypothetical protein DXG01_016589 [Tephrocybe rancida]
MDVYSSAKPAIFVLPPEILATIFIYVAHAFNPFSYQWMASVCHICQAWRAVALSVAALWSEVSFMDLRKVKELSTCFRATPLSVEAPFFEWQCRARRRTVFYIPPLVQEELERRMKSLISFTAQYAPQIRTYNVDMMREDVNDATLSQFFQLFSRPFPVLETLRIMLCRPTTFCMLPANALGRSSPSLRNLHLHGCAVHWNARWMFTELRSLYLMHGPPGFSLSLSMLLDCLNQIPHLNLLHLHIHLKDDRSSLTSIPTIIMLHLQSLYLSTDMPIAACLFQHINPNTPIKHVFGICDNANHPGDEPSFLMLVPAIVQRPGNDVNFVRLGRFLLEAWSDETLSPWDIDTLPSITIHIASLNYTSPSQEPGG